jgi:predicted RNase H-like nuclease (RuvC/YqgF family)
MGRYSHFCLALLFTIASICAADFEDAKDASRIASPSLVDQEQMAKFLSNLHAEKIFEGVSEQSKAALHTTLPSLKSAADNLAKDEAKSKQQYVNLVAQLENFNDQLQTLDANVHDATVKLAAAKKLRDNLGDAEVEIERLKAMLKSEESRRVRLSATVSSLQHSEQLINRHIARALRSSQANIAEGSVEGRLVDDVARLVQAGVGERVGEVAAHLQQLDAKLDGQIAELEAKKSKGRWRLADDSSSSDLSDD